MKKVSKIRVSITRECCYKCVYCHNETSTCEDKKFMTLENFKKVLEYTKSNDIKFDEIRITGGEPMLNPECFDILSYITDNYPKAKIGLNTSLVVNIPEILKIIKGTNLSKLVVGIDRNDEVSKLSPISNGTISTKEVFKNLEILINFIQKENKYIKIMVDTVLFGQKDEEIFEVNKMVNHLRKENQFPIHNVILEYFEYGNYGMCDVKDVEGFVKRLINEYDFINSTNDARERFDINNKNKEVFIDKDDNVIGVFKSFCRRKMCNTCMAYQIVFNSSGKSFVCDKLEK